jgi:O-succinylbenzoic acid--CoA ligase
MEAIPWALARHARLQPDRPAVIADGRGHSYADLAAEAERLAGGLRDLGVGAGDRVAVCLPAGYDFVALVHAAARAGAVLAPLNTRLTAEELAWQLADAAPRLVVWDRSLSTALPPLARDVALVATGAAGTTPGPLADAPELATLGGPPRTAETATAEPSLRPEAAATLIYTSGTTGRPKGVVLTHGNHLWSSLASALRLGLLPEDRWLLPLPLFHVGGMATLHRAALYGIAIVLQPRFEATAVAAAIASGEVSLASMVPTMLGRVLDAWGERAVPAGFRAVLLGGGPIAPSLLGRASDIGLPIAASYGLTEAASQVATAAPVRRVGQDDQGPQGLGAEPLAFTRLRIVDPAGVDLGPGEVGEILVGGPTVMAGYWRDPEATDRALAGGWLHTGDAGWLDRSGRLHVADRRDDLIVSGGENVYPAEVEAVLSGHEDVAEACVVGLPDPDWGQVVVAAVVRRSAALTEDALLAHARRHLAGYKAPRRIAWATTLPRTTSGKLRRDEVRASLERQDPRGPSHQGSGVTVGNA